MEDLPQCWPARGFQTPAAVSRRSFLADGLAIVPLAAAAAGVVATMSANPGLGSAAIAPAHTRPDAALLTLGAELDWICEHWDRWEPTASDEDVERYWAEVVSPLAERIEACSAATVAGLKVKARAMRFLAGDELQPEQADQCFERLGLAIVRELLALELQP